MISNYILLIKLASLFLNSPSQTKEARFHFTLILSQVFIRCYCFCKTTLWLDELVITLHLVLAKHHNFSIPILRMLLGLLNWPLYMLVYFASLEFFDSSMWPRVKEREGKEKWILEIMYLLHHCVWQYGVLLAFLFFMSDNLLVIV